MEKYSEEFSKLPASIQNVVKHGVELIQPQKVILFGSRARKDHHETSDFDLSFEGLKSSKEWSRFTTDISYENYTLFDTDLVIFEKMSPEYQKNIREEGVVLYEK
jgi:predicted nucleotidyltransferase